MDPNLLQSAAEGIEDDRMIQIEPRGSDLTNRNLAQQVKNTELNKKTNKLGRGRSIGLSVNMWDSMH